MLRVGIGLLQCAEGRVGMGQLYCVEGDRGTPTVESDHETPIAY